MSGFFFNGTLEGAGSFTGMASLLFLSSDILLGFFLAFEGAVFLLDGEPGLEDLSCSSSDSTADFFFCSYLSISPNWAKGR